MFRKALNIHAIILINGRFQSHLFKEYWDKEDSTTIKGSEEIISCSACETKGKISMSEM